MAKISKIEKNKQRLALIKKFAKKRSQLKSTGDYDGLDKLPKNASPVRYRNRCSISGRSRGYMRKFHISRICFREIVSKGEIPGIKKIN